MLRAELASRIRRQKLAGIEPVMRASESEEQRDRTFEIGVVRTPMSPQGPTLRDFRERQNLLDATVAVGRDDENGAGKVEGLVVQAKDDVVMELALLPMCQQIESAVALANLLEEGAEDHRAGEVLQGGHARIL